MRKFKVSWRNERYSCTRCGRKVGDVADYCYITMSNRGKRGNHYCAECGKIIEDSTKK